MCVRVCEKSREQLREVEVCFSLVHFVKVCKLYRGGLKFRLSVVVALRSPCRPRAHPWKIIYRLRKHPPLLLHQGPQGQLDQVLSEPHTALEYEVGVFVPVVPASALQTAPNKQQLCA